MFSVKNFVPCLVCVLGLKGSTFNCFFSSSLLYMLLLPFTKKFEKSLWKQSSDIVFHFLHQPTQSYHHILKFSSLYVDESFLFFSTLQHISNIWKLLRNLRSPFCTWCIFIILASFFFPPDSIFHFICFPVEWIEAFFGLIQACGCLQGETQSSGLSKSGMSWGIKIKVKRKNPCWIIFKIQIKQTSPPGKKNRTSQIGQTDVS